MHPTTSSTMRTRKRRNAAMHHALMHHLHLGSIRDTDWVSARFGHR